MISVADFHKVPMIERFWITSPKFPLGHRLFFFSSLQVIEQEEFANFIRDDAANVQGREECDSIPFIDDIRFYITNFVQSYSDTAEANRKLNLIEDLIEELGLDG
jgi:hypothetical protein